MRNNFVARELDNTVYIPDTIRLKVISASFLMFDTLTIQKKYVYVYVYVYRPDQFHRVLLKGCPISFWNRIEQSLSTCLQTH